MFFLIFLSKVECYSYMFKACFCFAAEKVQLFSNEYYRNANKIILLPNLDGLLLKKETRPDWLKKQIFKEK